MTRLLIGLAIAVALVIAPSSVHAQNDTLPGDDGSSAASSGPCETGSFFGLPPWYKYLDTAVNEGGACDVVFPRDEATNEVIIPETVGKILLALIEILMRVATLIAVGYVIYGGFRFVLSQGDSEKAKQARGTIINALIGVVIALSSVAMVNLLANTIIGG